MITSGEDDLPDTGEYPAVEAKSIDISLDDDVTEVTVVDAPGQHVDLISEAAMKIANITARERLTHRSSSSTHVNDPYWGPLYSGITDPYNKGQGWYEDASIVEVGTFLLGYCPQLLEVLQLNSLDLIEAAVHKKFSDVMAYERACRAVNLALRDIVYSMITSPNPKRCGEKAQSLVNFLQY